MKSELGLAIRLARIAVGTSQYQLAAQIGIHPTVLNMIENGKRIPNAAVLESALCKLRANAPKSHLASVILKEATAMAKRAPENLAAAR